MKGLVNIAIIVAVVSLIVGIISRAMIKPLMFGLEANAFLRFTNTCLLFAMTLLLMQILKAK